MEGFRWPILLAVLALAGPALVYGQDLPPLILFAPPELELSDDPQFEYGQPHKVIDGVGWVFGIPKKIILWDRRAVNHCVSAETQQNLAQYLNANGLVSTKVRINQYDPFGEWHRLREQGSRGRLALHRRRIRHAYLHAVPRSPVRRRPIQPLHGQRLHLFRHSLHRHGAGVACQTRPCPCRTLERMPLSPRCQSYDFGLRNNRSKMCSTTRLRMAHPLNRPKLRRSSTRSSAPRSAARHLYSLVAIFHSR